MRVALLTQSTVSFPKLALVLSPNKRLGSRIKAFLADREFIDEEWFHFLRARVFSATETCASASV